MEDGIFGHDFYVQYLVAVNMTDLGKLTLKRLSEAVGIKDMFYDDGVVFENIGELSKWDYLHQDNIKLDNYEFYRSYKQYNCQ